MGIPNETVTENEIAEKRRQEAKEEFRESQRLRPRQRDATASLTSRQEAKTLARLPATRH